MKLALFAFTLTTCATLEVRDEVKPGDPIDCAVAQQGVLDCHERHHLPPCDRTLGPCEDR